VGSACRTALDVINGIGERRHFLCLGVARGFSGCMSQSAHRMAYGILGQRLRH
jgi:hypothetical protein